MAIKQESRTQITLNSIDVFNNRTDIREHILNQWISENPNTKYRYFVENLSDGNRIYLHRPAGLNKGCDFVIYVENILLWKNGNDKPPKHDFVLDDLRDKKNLLPQTDWNVILSAIEQIYRCNTFQNSYSLLQNVQNINNGHSYELLLKVIRWFFIEQDVTYWSGQGRDMFYNAILNI